MSKSKFAVFMTGLVAGLATWGFSTMIDGRSLYAHDLVLLKYECGSMENVSVIHMMGTNEFYCAGDEEPRLLSKVREADEDTHEYDPQEVINPHHEEGDTHDI